MNCMKNVREREVRSEPKVFTQPSEGWGCCQLKWGSLLMEQVLREGSGVQFWTGKFALPIQYLSGNVIHLFTKII